VRRSVGITVLLAPGEYVFLIQSDPRATRRGIESVSVVKMRLYPMLTRGCDMWTSRSLSSILLSWCALVLSAGYALAQSLGPQPLPMPAPIAAPRDTPYLAAIRLTVDATDVERHIFKVRETIPVRAGEPLVLLYPQWLPGNHSPSGRVDKLAGLMIYANGVHVEWVRDPVDVFAFHVAVPSSATTLDVDFQFVSPVDSNEGRVVMTPDMLNLQWNDVRLAIRDCA
jgi:hypothetical protein